ncbi:MAG: hypothetical protein ACR2IE_07015 [Candidatus Sumerlaeaceae bacterium]
MATAFLDRVSNKAIGQMLLEKGIVSDEQLEEALAAAKRDGIRVGEALLALGYVTRDALQYVLGEQYGVRPMELHPSMIDERLVRRFPLELLQQHQLLPLIEVGDELVVVMSDPNATTGLSELSALAPAYTISPQLADAGQLRRCIESLSDRLPHSKSSVAAQTTPMECRLEAVIPQPTDPGFSNWLITTALQQPYTDLVLRQLGDECQVARQSATAGLEEIHRFGHHAFNAVRDALLRNCITLEYTSERAGMWETPLRLDGRLFEVRVSTAGSLHAPMVRLRPLEHLAQSSSAPDARNIPVLESGHCSIVLYQSLSTLEQFLEDLLLDFSGAHVIMLVQDSTRRYYESVYAFPAGITNLAEAASGVCPTCVIFDAPPSPADVYRLLSMRINPPAIIVCAPGKTAAGADVSPDIEELRRRIPTALLDLTASDSSSNGNAVINATSEGAQ